MSDQNPAGAKPNEPKTHVPCCSAHGVPMTCERYRRTHFVEVRPCCTTDRITLDLEVEAAMRGSADV